MILRPTRRSLIRGGAALLAAPAIIRPSNAWWQSVAQSSISSGGWALVTSASASGANGGISSAKNTSGAKLLVAAISFFNGAGPPTLSDSNSNSYSPLTTASGAISNACKLYYCANPIVGAGHTFTIAGVGTFSSLAVIALSGGTNATPFDNENGATGTSTSPSSGGVTPSVDNELVVIGVSIGGAATVDAINGGFTIDATVAFSGGVNYGVSIAHLAQGSAAATNPTVTLGASVDWAAAISAYKIS